MKHPHGTLLASNELPGSNKHWDTICGWLNGYGPLRKTAGESLSTVQSTKLQF